MILKEVKYGYDDLTIVPNVFTSITSRKEIVPTYSDGFYPIFTAPMASVVDVSNYDTFEENKIHAIIPRNVSYEKRIKELKSGRFVAFSLNEFEEFFCDEDNNTFKKSKTPVRVCIDLANGHMKKIYDLCAKAKSISISKRYTLIIMTGNIANSSTYREIVKMKTFDDNLNIYVPIVDYIRCSIGSGCGCITSSNTGIHYPIASLIDECNAIKKEMIYSTNKSIYDKDITKIVADGGIRNYDDIAKALALGADYVMIGSLFSKCIESAGTKFIKNGENNIDIEIGAFDNVTIKDGKWYETTPNGTVNQIGDIYVKYFGMASKDGQESISGKKTSTAEGITKNLKVEYILKKWVENFDSYLRSSMSYCNTNNLDGFVGTPTLVPNTNHETSSVNK